jgi:predicted dehydrogenase
MSDLKGALIGCGFFAVNQMHGWRDAEGARIVAICDRDPERLKAVGDAFGIERRYTSAEDLFADGGFDFVDIATTVGSHRALVEMAARHGVATICQKPIAPTMEDAKAMVAACEAAGVPLMVHENFRWQAPIRAVKAAIIDSAADRRGVLGPHLASARATTCFRASPISPRASASSSRISAFTCARCRALPVRRRDGG